MQTGLLQRPIHARAPYPERGSHLRDALALLEQPHGIRSLRTRCRLLPYMPLR
jgi:hypothetical protein